MLSELELTLKAHVFHPGFVWATALRLWIANHQHQPEDFEEHHGTLSEPNLPACCATIVLQSLRLDHGGERTGLGIASVSFATPDAEPAPAKEPGHMAFQVDRSHGISFDVWNMTPTPRMAISCSAWAEVASRRAMLLAAEKVLNAASTEETQWLEEVRAERAQRSEAYGDG